jgi:hypothetical protein
MRKQCPERRALKNSALFRNLIPSCTWSGRLQVPSQQMPIRFTTAGREYSETPSHQEISNLGVKEKERANARNLNVQQELRIVGQVAMKLHRSKVVIEF